MRWPCCKLRWKIFAALVLLPIVIIYYSIEVFIKPQYVEADAYTREQFIGRKTKRILFWTNFFSRDDFYAGFGKLPFEKCEFRDCETTKDKSLFNYSDVIFFHANDVRFNHLPKYRLFFQKWVFYNSESPLNTKLRLEYFKNVFNWTMTYRRDSDNVFPYSFVLPSNENTSLEVNFAQNRTKLVAWIVSNCKAHSKREGIVERLKKFIQIDIYGDCGESCPWQSQCETDLYNNYKFFLAFENGLCKDYVTEKFYRCLIRGIVPVVYGGADYEAVAPPNSYIDLRSFSSEESLAQYLMLLNNNDTLYNKYHEWRSKWKVIDGLEMSYCNLCKKIHQTPFNYSHSYENINHWWTSGQCKTP